MSNKDLIRRFERQSGLDVYGLGAKRVPWEAAMEKFAELIVLECSSICYKGLENGDEAASLLMNTFGVEE